MVNDEVIAKSAANVERQMFWALCSVNMVVAVDVLGMLLILPIIDTLSQNLGASKGMIGTMFTAYSVCAILSSFVLGKVSDNYGRRTIFLLSAFGTMTSAVAALMVTNFTELIVATAFSGLFTGTISTAYAYIGDITLDPALRNRRISYVTATLACCLVLGPLIGGMVSLLYLRAPFYISAALAALELLLVFFFLRNPKDLVDLQKAHLALLPDAEAGTNASAPASAQTGQEPQTASVPSHARSPSADHHRGSSFAEIIGAPTAAGEIIGNPLQDIFDSEETDKAGSRSGSNDDRGAYRRASATADDEEVEVPLNAQREPLLSSSPEDIPDEKLPFAWTDYRALLVSGMGVFLNTCTYLGLVTLVPLILQETSFGIVSDDESDEDLSNADTNHINFLMGTYLCVYGGVQVVGILGLFPRLSKSIGMLNTGALGCAIYGVSFCMMCFVHHTSAMYGIFAAMALGNSLSRPAFPAYLSVIAHPKKKAEYMSITTTFGNIATVFGGQLTLFYSYAPTAAILFAGLLSIVNAANLVVFAAIHREKTDATATK